MFYLVMFHVNYAVIIFYSSISINYSRSINFENFIL